MSELYLPAKFQANDIALVKLPEPLQYQSDPNIRPICLGLDEDNLFFGKGVATGWGRLYYSKDACTFHTCARLISQRVHF